MNKYQTYALGIAFAMMAAIPAAQAATYTFACLSNTNATNCADGAGASTGLVMDVTAVTGNASQVDFSFRNYSALGGILSEVYFDDGTLLGIASLSDSGANVNFVTNKVNPSDLPSGALASPDFMVTQGFFADSQPNANKAGVHNALDSTGLQEFLTIRFNLINGYTFNDTLRALNGEITHLADGVAYPALRVGLHVSSYSGNNNLSESYLNIVSTTGDPAPLPVPEADAYALMLAGFGLVGWLVRRRKS